MSDQHRTNYRPVRKMTFLAFLLMVAGSISIFFALFCLFARAILG